MKPIDENSSNELFSIKQLKEFEGFDGISDSEAEEIIKSLETFCRISFELYLNENSSSNDTS